MKRAITLSSALATWMLAATAVLAQNGLQQPQLVAPADEQVETLPVQSGNLEQTAFNYNLADDAAAPAAAEPAKEEPAKDAAPAASSGCGCNEEASCGCEEASCGCEPSCGCGGGCGCNDGCCLFGDCCLGDPCTLKEHVAPCCDHNFGGWIAAGYYSDQTGLSFFGPGLDFNDQPDNFNFDQVWLYAEKVAEADACSSDWGYRVDLAYGVDAPKFQAFGNGNNTWDNSFDDGIYGWAIPQAYAEVAFGDWSIKVGHFWTVEGYEVVPATGNFFYSHSLTFFNSEPFTHTGVLGTYSASDDTTIWAGWTLGWDTGYDQFDGGSNWLGGISTKVSDDVTFIYASSAGNFGFRSDGGGGYSQSVIAIADISDKTQYVIESDYTTTDGFVSFGPDFDASDYGIVNYLFYTLNDCWKAGGRMEWWKSNQVTGEATSFYELTGGVNYHAHANVVIRPEIRYDWSPTDFQGDYNRAIFGIDAVVTF